MSNRQDRRGQDVALAHRGSKLAKLRIGLKIGPLDVHVCDALAAGLREHLVARADHVFARGDFNLPWPARFRQKLRNAQAPGREGANRPGKRHGIGAAHDVQLDLARRYLKRLAVL